MPLFTTGNSQVDEAATSAATGLFSGLLTKATGGRVTLTPAGSLSADAKANIVRPPIQGQPNTAPQAMPAQPWYRKPIVMIGGAVLVVVGLVLLRRKRR